MGKHTTTKKLSWRRNPKKVALYPEIKPLTSWPNFLLKIHCHYDVQRSHKKLLLRKLKRQQRLQKKLLKMLSDKYKKLKITLTRSRANLEVLPVLFGGSTVNFTNKRNICQQAKVELPRSK